ncbi:type II/IV secretion system protein [Candidatus Peregrinibacteria bacterium]|nr:MAG: type II/IV secretion system protein [Candidatus Peregrinibacteria bacterium]
MPTTNQKLAGGVQKVNAEMREAAIKSRAEALSMPYINLLSAPLNSDLVKLIPYEIVQAAQAALFLQSGKQLRLAVSDPENAATIQLTDQLKSAGYTVQVYLASEESIQSAHRIYFSNPYPSKKPITNVVQEQEVGSFSQEIADLKHLKERVVSAPFNEALNMIQLGGYKARVSDIHFQPERERVEVRFRVDGVLMPVFDITHEVYLGILKEIKYLSHLKLNITHVPQDGQYSFKINAKLINVRVSTLPIHYGEACVMRLLDSESARIPLDQLGFSGEALRLMHEAVGLAHGMILITGPTGSGKSTTLYSMLSEVDVLKNKVITLEDPIEYYLNGVAQSQINTDYEYGFATGLRAILRQDPDIIMVGEIRDIDTAETAAQASLTGHLVLSTLHTNSAIESIPRLINMGVKSFILAPALDLIVAQRLVRRLCTCATVQSISESERVHLDQLIQGITAKGMPASSVTQLKRPAGCDLCSQTGFKGQLVIAEVLRFDADLRQKLWKTARSLKFIATLMSILK